MVSSAPDLTTTIVRHERRVVAGIIALLVALSWWFLAAGAGMGGSGGGMDLAAMPMHATPPLSALILMWWLMMAAMMLPSAAPAILLYAKVRAQRRSGSPIVQPSIFLAGYLLIWLAFSVMAAFLQQQAAGPAMQIVDARVASGLLIAAGLYQLSPFKSACLRQCRSPAQFISRHWRSGHGGAARLGVLHGAYCVGCCWMLMALLFVGGVMNFAWIAALTLIVGVEKLLPGGEWLGRAAGIALIVWGLLRIIG